MQLIVIEGKKTFSNVESDIYMCLLYIGNREAPDLTDIQEKEVKLNDKICFRFMSYSLGI